jgi:Amt family ammonium transporter
MVFECQWFFWGYSLAFSDGANAYIGDLKYFALMGVEGEPSMGSPRIPALVFAIYQCMFAAITYVFSGVRFNQHLTRFLLSPVIAIGAIAERGRLGPTLVFTFIWSTIVYNPLACMTWNAKGWSFVKGGLDFAGGTPVHISSGTAALAISIYLGKRTGYGTEKLAYKPHNTTYVVLGTVFLWFGWFGFNGGSALSANLRAASGLRRHQPRCFCRRIHLDALGLSLGAQVVCCRLLLWRHLWFGCHHPSFWFCWLS